jgi:hypothetical protein
MHPTAVRTLERHMRLKLLTMAVGATLVAGLGTAAHAQASQSSGPSPTIIGGTTVPAGGAPWGAQISAGGFCSGAVIDQMWVLTAAHCGSGGSVLVGSQQLGQGRRIQVVQDFTNGDVAVKKLASPANVQVLPLASTAPPVGATVQIYGWGGISAPGGPLAQSIKTANLRVVRVGTTIDGTGINGQAYFGDSGGPMVYNGQVIGTCTGPVDSNPDPVKLTVGYQNLPERISWIRQVTGIDGSPPPTNPPPTNPPPTNPPPTNPPPGTTAWAAWTSYTAGQRVTYGGRTYECWQSHQSQPGWEPPNTPALWKAL